MRTGTAIPESGCNLQLVAIDVTVESGWPGVLDEGTESN